MFRLVKLLSLFLIFILILFGIVFARNLRPVKDDESDDNTQIVLEISQGTSFNEITSQLKEKGLVRREIVFKIFTVLSGKAHQLKPGKYFLSKNLSAKEVINE